MEKISELLQERTLSIQSTNISTINNGEISIYKDSLSKNGVKKNCVKILAAFRGVDKSFINLLAESLKRNKFTDARFEDAVNHVIDTCKYPTPSISDFVSYDRTIKVYTYQEMVKNCFDFDMFEKVRLTENQKKPLWIMSTDFELNNFIKWEK